MYKLWVAYQAGAFRGSNSTSLPAGSHHKRGILGFSGPGYERFPTLNKARGRNEKSGGVVLLPEGPSTPMQHDANWRPPTLTPWAHGGTQDMEMDDKPPTPPAAARVANSGRGWKGFWSDKGGSESGEGLQSPPPEYGRFTGSGTPSAEIVIIEKEKFIPLSQLGLTVVNGAPSHKSLDVASQTSVDKKYQSGRSLAVNPMTIISPKRVSSFAHQPWSHPPPSPGLPPPPPPSIVTTLAVAAAALAASSTPSTPVADEDERPLPRPMIAVNSFNPSLSDELPVTIGETLMLLEEFADGWCFAQRVGSSNELGALPRFCLAEVDSASDRVARAASIIRKSRQTTAESPHPATQDSPRVPTTSSSGGQDAHRGFAQRQHQQEPTPPPSANSLHSFPSSDPASSASKTSRFSSWGSMPPQLSPAFASSGHPSRVDPVVPQPTLNVSTAWKPLNIPQLPNITISASSTPDSTRSPHSLVNADSPSSRDSPQTVESPSTKPPPAPRVSRFLESSNDDHAVPPARSRVVTMPPLSKSSRGRSSPGVTAVGFKRFTGALTGGLVRTGSASTPSRVASGPKRTNSAAKRI